MILKVTTFVFIILLIILGTIVSFRKCDRTIKIITFFLLFSFLKLISPLFFDSILLNNFITFHFYPIIEFLFWIMILSQWDKYNKKVYFALALIIGAQILIESIITPIIEIPIRTIIAGKAVLIISFLRIIIITDTAELKHFKYLSSISLVILFSTCGIQIINLNIQSTLIQIKYYIFLYLLSVTTMFLAFYFEFQRQSKLN